MHTCECRVLCVCVCVQKGDCAGARGVTAPKPDTASTKGQRLLTLTPLCAGHPVPAHLALLVHWRQRHLRVGRREVGRARQGDLQDAGQASGQLLAALRATASASTARTVRRRSRLARTPRARLQASSRG